ncbi:MAG: restriction endonuclease subunit S [Lachnospiraceae bacterium oral taxon 082]|nr:restriction endonuclease subunit S [Lachnospiraceae bacterium oral taxon 082]
MNLKYYRFDEVTVNFDKKRVPLSSAQRSNRGGEFPYYGAQGVIDHIDDYIFDGEYLLIAEDGENLKSKKQNIAQIATGKFWVNNHAHIVTGNEKCDTRYLCYLINSMDLSGYITGSAQPKLSQANLNAVQLSMPTLEQQKRIVEYLVAIDNKIALNELINNNLEQQVSSLYKSWFEDFDPTNGVCPDNWSNQMLSTIADISSGKRPPIKSEVYSQETPISIVGAASVMGFTSEANHTDKILVTGRVGTHGVIQRFNTPCWTSDNTLVITSPFYEFTNQILHRIDYSSMNRGSTQPLITQGDMKKVVVLVPDEETLAKFEVLAGSLMAQWETNNNENVRLASLVYTLLPKLMSGELDVSNLDI